MKIWIVNPYGVLPGEGWREYRSTIIGETAYQFGHNVNVFISDFDTRKKIYRSKLFFENLSKNQVVTYTQVSCGGYKKNISFGRIYFELKFGKKFAELTKKLDKPELIILAIPCLFYSKQVVNYAKENNIKIVLDVIDIWPELFKLVLPKFLKPIHRIIFFPLYKMRDSVVKESVAVVGVSKDYVATVLKKYNNKNKLVSYLGLDVDKFRLDLCRNNSLISAGLISNNRINVIYSGTLGDAYDIPTIISAAIFFAKRQFPVQFLFVGDGPRRSQVELLCSKYPKSAKYLGVVNVDELPSIYRNCDVGLVSYLSDSTVAVPVKFFDYVAAGLAIVNSLSLEISEIISKNSIGINYLPESSDSLITAIQTYINNRDLLKSHKIASFSIAKNYDHRTQYRKYIKFIEENV